MFKHYDGPIEIHVHFHNDAGDPGAVARIEDKLDRILKGQKIMQNEITDLTTAAQDETTAIDSISALVTSMAGKLELAVANAKTVEEARAAVTQVTAGMRANSARIAGLVLQNTEVPVPPVGELPPPVETPPTP